MLDLETGVEFEEVEDILYVTVKIWIIRGLGWGQGLKFLEGLTRQFRRQHIQ